jgi:FkbM family methyltransferase
MLNEAARVRLTTSCRDTDRIPKVAGAGDVRVSGGRRVQVMHNGVLVVEGGYYGDWMTDIISTLRGHHEPQEEVVFHEIVGRLASEGGAPTVVELGAFWAYYTLWAMQRMPSTRAILVEPDPHNLEVGRVNLALNGRQAELVQAAVGAGPRPPEPFTCESDGQSRLVPTVGLCSLLQRFDIDRVDLLLADVQGAETSLLEGAGAALAERVRFVVVSTHHHAISGDPLTHERCRDLLVKLGAHIIAEHTVAESFSGDGLIAASFDDRDRDLVVAVSQARARESLFGDPLEDLARERSASAAALRSIRAEAETAAVEASRASADLADAQAQLTAIRSTATWRLHDRLQGSRAGRLVLAGGRRVGRVLGLGLR